MPIPVVKMSIEGISSGYLIQAQGYSGICKQQPNTIGFSSPNWRCPDGDHWIDSDVPKPVLCSDWKKCIIRFTGEET